MPKRRIQKGKANNQTIYIDSCFVDDYLWGGKEANEHARRVFHKIESALRNSNIEVVIPFVSVGEIINTMIRENKQNKINDMFTLFNNLNADTPSPNRVVIEKSLNILNDDERFDPTDAIIAAHALCDEYSTCLLTKDTNMQTSMVLSELEERIKQKRKHKLKITDVF